MTALEILLPLHVIGAAVLLALDAGGECFPELVGK